MKKILLVAALFASLGFVSCGKSIEEKAKYFQKEAAEAIQKGDNDKLRELMEEEEKYMKTLSDEELEAYQNMTIGM